MARSGKSNKGVPKRKAITGIAKAREFIGMSDEAFLASGKMLKLRVVGNRWEFVSPKPLGEGGQGLAFRVRDKRGELKGDFVLKEAKSTDDKPLKRFRREIEATQKLNHPNVISVVDFGLPPGSGTAFYVMPFCEGGSLWNFVKAHQSDLARTLDGFLSICAGVAAAHAKGLMHHDLKPANVLLDGEGVLKVSDFGICVDLLDAEERFTRTDEWKGPKGFRPPELEGGRLSFDKITPATDVYMLGKILWYMVGAAREDEVFTREDFKDTRWNLYARKADTRRRYINERILERSVLKEPSQRLQSVEELISEVTTVKRLVSGGFEPLAKQGMTCKFCGLGEYQVMQQLWLGVVAGAIGGGTQGGAQWRGLNCDKCGHVQLFRAELTEPRNDWLG